MSNLNQEASANRLSGVDASRVEALLARYDQIHQLQVTAEAALAKVISESPEIEALIDKLKETERQQMELYICQASKNAPVDVAEESYISTWDSFRGKTVTQLAVDRASAKRKARKLLQHFHPDRATGDAATFDIIRKAVRSADIELIHLWNARVFHDASSDGITDLGKRIEIRFAQTQGHPFFKFAQLYYSGNLEQLKSELVNKLNERIKFVVATNLGAV